LKAVIHSVTNYSARSDYVDFRLVFYSWDYICADRDRFFLWGRKEAHIYELSLLSRRDLREFMERTPERPEPGALKHGGIIGLVLGAWFLIGGLFFL